MRDIMSIPPQELGKGSPIKVEILETRADVANDFARVMAAKIRENNALGKPTAFILPVGPTSQYRRLARLCNVEGISCRNLITINMDEYCLADGNVVPFDHPMGFRGFMEREFFSLLDEDKKVPQENIIFPDPQDLEALPRKIEDIGGVDIAFGGIGINGHIAFNEAMSEEEISAEEFRELGTRVIDLATETIAINAACGMGGDLKAIPPKAVTVGMKEILAARETHFYLDWPWQRAVARRAIHGPVTPEFPASFLQTHPRCTITMSAEVAALPGPWPR